MKKFWGYFERIWGKSFPSQLWNVHSIDSLQLGFGFLPVVNRTNNPVERYNKKLNCSMPSHPSIVVFVQSIRTHAIEAYNDYEYCRTNRTKSPVHQGLTTYLLPEDYISFKQ